MSFATDAPVTREPFNTSESAQIVLILPMDGGIPQELADLMLTDAYKKMVSIDMIEKYRDSETPEAAVLEEMTLEDLKAEESRLSRNVINIHISKLCADLAANGKSEAEIDEVIKRLRFVL